MKCEWKRRGIEHGKKKDVWNLALGRTLKGGTT